MWEIVSVITAVEESDGPHSSVVWRLIVIMSMNDTIKAAIVRRPLKRLLLSVKMGLKWAYELHPARHPGSLLAIYGPVAIHAPWLIAIPMYLAAAEECYILPWNLWHVCMLLPSLYRLCMHYPEPALVQLHKTLELFPHIYRKEGLYSIHSDSRNQPCVSTTKLIIGSAN